MWRNSPNGYGWTQILLHWLLALAIVAVFAIGLYMRELSYYDPGYQVWPVWHKSIGVLIALLMLIRLSWRALNPKPQPIGSPWQQRLAAAVHGALYLLIFMICATGYLIASADGRPMELLLGVSLPSLGSFDETAVERLNLFHQWPAWIVIALAALHAAAALYHHFFLGDSTLRRMLKPLR